MSSVVISGDTSGAITLTAPSVAGTNTITLPAATGTAMVSGNMPTFNTTINGSNQTISNNTDTVVLFNSNNFDTASAYTAATGKFQPAIAGYYQINANILLNGNSITLGSSDIRKNGSLYARIGTIAAAFTSLPVAMSGSTVVYLNGSTDYIQITAYITATSSQSVGISSSFSGCLVRTA
jgi:C1q domain